MLSNINNTMYKEHQGRLFQNQSHGNDKVNANKFAILICYNMLFLLSLFDNEHWIILRIKLVVFIHLSTQQNYSFYSNSDLIEILKYGVSERLLVIKQW